MRRPDYTPLQPLPDVVFEPTETILVYGGSGTSVPFEAEVFEQYAITLAYDSQLKVVDNLFVVLHRKSSAAFAIFNDLRVARAFALELQETLDFDILYERWKLYQDQRFRQVALEVQKRAQHPANINARFSSVITEKHRPE